MPLAGLWPFCGPQLHWPLHSVHLHPQAETGPWVIRPHSVFDRLHPQVYQDPSSVEFQLFLRLLPWFAEDMLRVGTRVVEDGPDNGAISSSSFTAWRWMSGGWAAKRLTRCSPCPPFPRAGENINPSQTAGTSPDHQLFTGVFPIFSFTVWVFLLSKWCDTYTEEILQAVRFYGVSGMEESRSSCWQQVLKMKRV